MKTKKAERVLKRIQKQFPHVTNVRDAENNIRIQVTKKDSASGRRKDPNQCALARACIRTKHADGAIIGVGYSYIIKGTTATRYKTSVGVGREITSFDRHHDFAPGSDYLLSKVSRLSRLDADKTPYVDTRNRKKPSGKEAKVYKHRTARIRVMERS